MADVRNGFGGVASGTGLTVGNTGGISGNALDATVLGAGATATADNTQAHRGLVSAKLSVGGSAADCCIEWSTKIGTSTTIYFRGYFYFTSNPATNHRIFDLVSSPNLCGAAYLTTTGKVEMVDTGGGQMTITATSVTLNQWVRIEGKFVASATVGSAEVRLYNVPDSPFATEVKQSAASFNTQANFQEYRFGAAGDPMPANRTIWVAHLGLSTVTWIGPLQMEDRAPVMPAFLRQLPEIPGFLKFQSPPDTTVTPSSFPVGADLALLWDISGPVGKDLALQWDARAELGDTLALQWDVRSIAGQQSQLIWDVRAAVSQSIQLIWDVIGPVAKELGLVWDVRATLGDTVALQWDVRSALGDELGLVWDVRSIVGDDLALVWDLRAPIGDTVTLQWDIRAVLGDTLQLIWDVRASTGDDLQLIWDVQSIQLTAGKDLALLWDVRAASGKPVSLVWDVRAAIADAISLVWDVRASVPASVQLIWDVRSTVGDTADLGWDVRSLVADDISLRWTVLQQIARELQLIWVIESDLAEFVLVARILERWSTHLPSRWVSDIPHIRSTIVPSRWRTEVMDE